MAGPTDAIEKIVEAFSKVNESKQKFNTEIIKQRIRQDYTQRLMAQKTKEASAIRLKEAEAKQMADDPMQTLLKRRYAEENPIGALSLFGEQTRIEPGQNGGFSVTQPAEAMSQVEVNPLTSKYEKTPITAYKNIPFMQKYEDMMEKASRGEGPPPPAGAKPLYEKMLEKGRSSGVETPEGFINVGGKLFKDPSFKRMLTPEERTNKLQDEIDKKELSSMATNLPKLDQAFQATSQLKDLFYGALTPTDVKKGDVVGGIKNRLSGPLRTVAATIGTNPQLNRYLANRKAFSGLTSKGGFGEAGMLTNQDIERVINALPNEYSTSKEAEIGFKEVEGILGAARTRFENKKKEYLSRATVADEEPIQAESDDFSTLWS